jgi:hypothetical protein
MAGLKTRNRCVSGYGQLNSIRNDSLYETPFVIGKVLVKKQMCMD